MRLSLFHPSDDFFTDRLCRRYGVAMFCFVAMLIGGAYVSPWAFSCWTPAQFTSSHVDYTNRICWNIGSFHKVMNSDEIPQNDITPPSKLLFNFRRMRYSPLLLILQALLFLLPRVLWNGITVLANFPTGRLVSSAHHLIHGVPPGTGLDKHSSIQSLAARVLASIQNPFPILGGTCSMLGGYMLSLSYIVCKLCYSAICILQIVIISKFLGINFFAFGFGRQPWDEYTVFQAVQVGNVTVFKAESLFPRVVLCDFEIRHQTRVHSYVTQCEISANEIVERAYLILWFWIWITICLLSISTFLWVLRILFYIVAPLSYKTKRVLVYFGQQPASSPQPKTNHVDKKAISNFAKQLLKPDGSLLLEMLEENVSLVAASEVVRAAWRIYQEQDHGRVVQHEAIHFHQSDATSGGQFEEPPLGGASGGQTGPTNVYQQLLYPAKISEPESIPLVQRTEL